MFENHISKLTCILPVRYMTNTGAGYDTMP